MPKKIHRKLELEARKKGFSGERKDKYVYGTLRKTGWVPATKRKGKKKTKGRKK